MNKDFLYCESTQLMIRNNDVVTLSTDDTQKWIVKHGWFMLNGKQTNGWYLKSISDGTLIDINTIQLSDISLSDGTTVDTQPRPISLDSLSEGDIVTVDGYDSEWVVRYGTYLSNNTRVQDWYLQSLTDTTILPFSDLENTTVSIIVKGDTKGGDVLPQSSPVYDYIVIPGTNIRIYDNDVVVLTTNPTAKHIVHNGWYIYNGVQNYGWYLCSIKNGSTIPVSAIDLTTVQLISTRTQGSTKYDGPQVKYTRPFTEHDGVLLNRAFITLDTLEQRDNLSPNERSDGRLVRVNNAGGNYAYYSWSESEQKWKDITFETTLPIVTGTAKDEVILSQLNPGMYIVKGQYRVSSTDATQHISMGDTLVTISTNGDLLYIKDLNSSTISDYVVDSADVITIHSEYVTKDYLQDVYATIEYVDTQIQAMELHIQEYVTQTIYDVVPSIVDQILEESLHEITEEYVDGLFNKGE